VSACGGYVFASNRGHDSISVMSFDDETGELQLCGEPVKTGGKTPRHFDVEGELLIAANQDSDSLVAFRQGKDGALTETGGFADVPSPACVLLARL